MDFIAVVDFSNGSRKTVTYESESKRGTMKNFGDFRTRISDTEFNMINKVSIYPDKIDRRRRKSDDEPTVFMSL